MSTKTLRSRPALGYSFAVSVWLVTFVAQQRIASGHIYFGPVEDGQQYLLFFPAVLLVTAFAGIGPSVCTALLAGLSIWWVWAMGPGLDWRLLTCVALLCYSGMILTDVLITTTKAEALALKNKTQQATADNFRHDVLMREVQHRVSNNIQTVSALLQLSLRDTDDPEARRVLDQAISRTSMIAKMQRNLMDASGNTAPFKVLASELSREALMAAGRRDVEVAIEDSNLCLTPEETTPVMLILLECLSNALEHGLPDLDGQIRISLTENEQQRQLVVHDDGVGPPLGFAVEDTDSLGLKLVMGMTQQLRGDFDLKPGWPGTHCSLTYPRPFSV